MNGPRDWSQSEQPRYGERLPDALVPQVSQAPPPSDERRRSGHEELVGRGVLWSLLVLPIAVLVWVLLWGSGWVSAVVPWGAALGVTMLYRAGAGTVSQRGATAITVVTMLTVGLSFFAGLSWVIAEARAGSSDSAAVFAVFGEPAFWSALPADINAGATWSGWMPAAMIAAVMVVIGVAPVLWAVHQGQEVRVSRSAVLWSAGIVVLMLSVSFMTRLHEADVQSSGWVLTDGNAVGSSSGAESGGDHAAAGIDLVVGDCLAIEPDAAYDAEGPIPTRVSCSEPHVTEVFAEIGPLGEPGDAYPGDDEVFFRAVEACLHPFKEFIGVEVEHSAYGMQVHRPFELSWDAGNRSARCLVISDEPVTGSLHGVEQGSMEVRVA